MSYYYGYNGNMAIVYKITSPENKCYVGTTTRDLKSRIREHRYWSKKRKYNLIYEDMKKYGFDKFEFSLLETCDDSKRFEREAFWISELNTFKNGYNKSNGGQGPSGFCPTKEQRINSSKQMKRLHKDPKFLKKLRAITKNSEAQSKKAKIGGTKKGLNQPLISVYDNGKYLGDFRTGVSLAKVLGVCETTACRYLCGKIGRGRFTLVRKEG